MNQSTITSKIDSILKNEPQVQLTESLSNYCQYHVDKVTPDLLEKIWEHAHDGMMLTDSDGLITAVNPAFCLLVRMEESELIGFPFTVIYDHSTDRQAIFDNYKVSVRTKKFSSPYEKIITFISGASVFVEVLTTMLIDDAEEIFVLTELRNISSRKKWEYSLQESENRYRSLFENSVLPMYQSNVEGKFVNANVALLQLLGYETFDELNKINLERDVYVNAQQRVKLFLELQSGGTAKPYELELKKSDGTKITVMTHARILKDEFGTIIGFEGALEDISERKALEQKLQANIAMLEATHEEMIKINTQKDKILTIVSHDLRSPFSSILGFCELLTTEFQSLSDREKLEYVGFINDAAVQQLNLVNSILDWSGLETGKVRLKLQPVNIVKVASEVMTSLLGISKKRSIELRLSIPANTVITADEQLIRQLLFNLIGNALKFTPKGGKINLQLSEDVKTRTVFQLIDTGIGIPEEDLKKLFKVEEKYTRQGLEGENGTGLGLPMCFEIMNRHHGEISVSSEEGKGTIFTLTFRKEVKSNCKKILIVDDQKGNRQILSRFMKRISDGAETIFAETGKEALESMLTEMPDLVMTDYHMPAMNGLELIRRMRNDDTMKHIPVVLISGDNLEYYADSDVMTKVLKKPIIFNELKEVMEKIIF